MKRLIVPVLAGIALLAAGTVGEANDKLLEILKSKGIITDEQLTDLKKESAKEVKTYYKDGFKMGTADGDFALRIGGKVRADFRYFDDAGTDSSGKGQDTFDLRRASISVKGTLYRYYDFKVGSDFSSGTAKLKDAYIKYTYFPQAVVKLGQFKVPYGAERLISSKYYPFLERSSITSALAYTRDRGVGVEGSLLGGYLYYDVGVFNGSGSNATNNNDDLDYAARLVFHPTAHSKGLLKLAVAASYSAGQQRGVGSKDIDVKTETKSGNYYFIANVPTTRNYDRRRSSVWATALYGPAMLTGEYMRADYDFGNDAKVTGGYVLASYILTGEERSLSEDKVVYGKVKRPFEPDKKQWGGWEVAARYSWFNVDDRFFQSNGLYPGWTAVSKTAYANEGDAWGTSLNWRVNDVTRIMANWVHSKASNDLPGGRSNIFTHDGGNNTDTEDAFLMRVQVEF